MPPRYFREMYMDLRNIAIIAHVDHGKTTLVDELLKQSGAFRENQAVAERAMDSNDIERERGITILAKATSVEWKGIRINIVDTPGHADFGGEVERILNMVDGVVLLVDAAEGPMPQTKFVTSKALALGLKPIVVLNKVDKPDAEPDRAHNEVFDLFAALDATDEQLDFPTMYASGRAGWADMGLNGPRKDLSALFDLIVAHVPAPAQVARRDEPFRMLATTLGSDPFIGRILTGRVESGTLKAGDTIKALSRTNERIEQFRVSKILAFRGLSQQPIDLAEAGDIVTIAGMSFGALSANANHGVDQQTCEARAYAVAREFRPLLVNTVVGFIGPEYLYNGKQIIRAGLEDHFCGKLLGVPMGCDICYTNHAEADQDDMDMLLTLLGTAGINFIMGIPGSDDVMLNYQTTSFHDALYVRQVLGLRPAPEFEEWLAKMQILRQDGNRLQLGRDLPEAFRRALEQQA